MTIDASNVAARMDAKLHYFKKHRKEIQVDKIIKHEINTKVDALKNQTMAVVQTLQVRQQRLEADVTELTEEVASVNFTEASEFQIENLKRSLDVSKRIQQGLQNKFAESKQKLIDKKTEKAELQKSLQNYLMTQKMKQPSTHQGTISQISRNLCTYVNKEVSK